MQFSFETNYFESLEDFANWKSIVEETNSCYYVRARGDVINKNSECVKYYQCNRCGAHKSRSTGKRLMKSSGTSKINMNCTSTLKIMECRDGSVTIEICHTHYGHKLELEHTKLTILQKHQLVKI